MSLFEITQQERAWWQRQAAAGLASILDPHPDLPAIAWTVGPAGSVLIGHVNGLSPGRAGATGVPVPGSRRWPCRTTTRT